MPRFEQAETTLLRYKLDQPVGGSGVAAIDVVLVELRDSDGAAGLGFTYVIGGVGGEVVLAAARSVIERLVLNQPCLPPQVLWRHIAASFNRSGLGPNMVALAAIDVAVWDLEANRRGCPWAWPWAVHHAPFPSMGVAVLRLISPRPKQRRRRLPMPHEAFQPSSRGCGVAQVTQH